MEDNFEFEPAKKFWNAHKGKLAVIATTTTVLLALIMAGQQSTIKEFLDENDLADDFDDFLMSED